LSFFIWFQRALRLEQEGLSEAVAVKRMKGVRVGPQDQRQDEEARGDEQIANPNEHRKLVAWRRQTARKNRQPVWRHAAGPPAY
jgi:hypothetical protein